MLTEYEQTREKIKKLEFISYLYHVEKKSENNIIDDSTKRLRKLILFLSSLIDQNIGRNARKAAWFPFL